MLIAKSFFLLLVFILSMSVGVLTSKKYTYRLNELIEFKKALNFFKTKIKFTYEPIPIIFKEISKNLNTNINKIFDLAGEKMDTEIAERAWEISVDLVETNVKEEDKVIIKSFSKLLGKTDALGQISQIDITNEFIDKQIKEAENEKKINDKICKVLGCSCGLALIIILI